MAPHKRNKTENVNPNIRESTTEEAKVDASIVIPNEKKNETDSLVKLSQSQTFSIQNPQSKIQNGITNELECTAVDTTSTDSIKDKVENSKSIDPSLNLLVQQIEKQNSNLSVVVARQFCYKIAQTLMEVMISEPRKFNVLEEFILRASLEFTPEPTSQELASILGLDTIFVQSTAENLVRFKSLKFSQTGKIQITPQGQEFYQQGNVSLPPQGKQIYAIADPFAENLTFQFEALPLGLVNLPDLAELVSIENHLPSLQSLTTTDIQQLIRIAGLGLHVPEEGKIVTNFQMIGKPQICWRTISILVLLDTIENKYIIQVRRDKQILEKASNWLTELQAQQKFDLNKLGILSQEKTPVSQSTAKPKRQRATTKKTKSVTNDK
jgi:hypothetical protein